MNWLNLELKTLRSTEYLGADPVQRATWINLLSFCADHENGGVIEGSAEWNDRKWMQLTGITLEEAKSDCDLWEWKDGGVSVKHYPVAQEQKVKRNRRNGKKGGRPSTDKADGYPHGLPHGSADGSVSLKRNSNSNSKGIEKKEEVVVATAPPPVAFNFVCKDGSAYALSQSKLSELKDTFRNADVEREIRVAANWCEANPSKRKTKAGMPRFLSAWLTKADEKAVKPKVTYGTDVVPDFV